MKKLLNTLYVTTDNAYLGKDGTNVVVSLDGKEIFRIPILNIESICTFGYQGASPGLMRLCADNGVSLAFFSPRGRFITRCRGPVNGNIILRKRQFDLLHDTQFCLKISSLFTTGKIFNSRVTLRRFVRDYPDRPGVDNVESSSLQLKHIYQSIGRLQDMESLRGAEGRAAAIYFDAFPYLILNQSPYFSLKKRIRRPPTDIVNAMLSMGYSLLANDCVSALEGVGLDPAAGFMHTLRPGRNSLALDLMEEMRSYIVDRLVLSMINTRQISHTDFMIHTDNDDINPAPVLFTDSGLKKFLAAWQAKKRAEIIHPFLNEKIRLGLLPHIQAMLLARYLRHDLDNYPVFLAK
ncbi:MAG: type I-C CRISPR-associated endonuclease Cas1c [Bacteroidales bacterium]|nr:type I-C CRISPR-associated endonuclease Cas1c [Bacteroidales bacterium]